MSGDVGEFLFGLGEDVLGIGGGEWVEVYVSF